MAINLNNIRSHGLSKEEEARGREWRILKCGSPRVEDLKKEFGRFLRNERGK